MYGLAIGPTIFIFLFLCHCIIGVYLFPPSSLFLKELLLSRLLFGVAYYSTHGI